MIDFDILKHCGSTNARLREVLTAKAPPVVPVNTNETAEEKELRIKREQRAKIDVANRQLLEREVRVRIDEGVVRSLKDYQFYAAADIAWDSSPVNKATIPLIMYAQGKINIQTAATALESCGKGSDYVKKDGEGKAVSIDMPKFFEHNINLVRSFITRRLAAQSNNFSNLFPHYKYESRSTGTVGKCRADVLSQRVEIMTDQYSYRHHDVQCMRDAFLYSHSVDFIASSWDIERQYCRKEVASDLESADPNNFELDTQIVREGLLFYNPHPTRVFWDNNYPLESINADIGCQYIGYWDVKRFADIAENTAFFNTDSIGWSTRFWGIGGIYLNYKSYFDQFLTQIKPPCFPEGTTTDPAGENDRKTNVGVYSVDQKDTSIVVATYFKRMVPKEFGIGDYPFPVWVRGVVASDSTWIFAEFLPSTPAAYLGINENDSRMINISVAHELMAYQDQLSNLFTDMLLLVQIELFKAIGINTDALTKEQVDYIRSFLKGTAWGAGTPMVYEFSYKKMQELGVKADQVVTVTGTQVASSLNAIFEAMAKLIAMAEKLMAMSPAEQGQPAPREISATEVNEIASTTTSVYSFISNAIDEFRAAKKRIIYESLVVMSEGEIRCPVMDRYTTDTIKKAGFKPLTDEQEEYNSPMGVKRHTVIGTKRALIHDYIFTSRDGAERAVNTQAANTLVQLVSQCLNVPAVLSAMGKEKLYEIFNEIFRMSGAGVDLNLELKPGEDNSLGEDQVRQFQQVLEQMQKALQQLAGQVQQDAQSIQQQQAINKNTADHFKVIAKLGQEVQTLVAKGAKESISINYKDAPPDVQRQMERAAGFQPSTTGSFTAKP